MTSRAALVTLAACAAASLACGEREREEPGAAATAAAPQGEGASGRAAGRARGDRHARAAARRTAVKRVDGTVARTGERQVVIGRRGEPELTLRVTPDSAVTVDGEPARLEDVPEGAEVRAAYRTGDYGRPTALSIEVRSRTRTRTR